MKTIPLICAPAALLPVLLAVPLGAPAQTIDTTAMREVTAALAHDSLRGRDTGTAGERAAARIIAEALARLALEPAHPGGFVAPLPLLRVRMDTTSRVVVGTGADSAMFQAGLHFFMRSAGRDALRSFAGPAVLVADDATPPDSLRDVVVVTIQPPGEAQRARTRAWIRAGVRGVIVLVPSESQFAALRDGADGWLTSDARVDEPVWQPDLPILFAGPSLSAALLDGVALPLGFDGPLPLERSVDAQLQFAIESITSANIAGVLRGSDPVLRHEFVVLTAHYDHLGVGPALGTDSVYNGFSDNAAGVAMLLAIADALRPAPPSRSVLFLFPSGEERGLLGSSAWVADPPVPLERVTAALNLDAGAPPAPPVRWRVAGDTGSIAVREAAAVVRALGWTADVTGANANSDHWPFLDRGIPTVFLVPGRDWEGLDEAGRDRLFARWDRYHRPDDEWHPEYPFSGLARYAALALEITRRLAARAR